MSQLFEQESYSSHNEAEDRFAQGDPKDLKHSSDFETELSNSISSSSHNHVNEESIEVLKRRTLSLHSILNSPLLRPILALGVLPTANAYKPLFSGRNLMNVKPLDPISLITLFFDSPEKDILNKTGDMTLLTCFGLFVNPSTMWSEYRTLHPGQGITYYNPGKKITSTVEIQQVNNYLTAVAEGRRNCGVVVNMKPLERRSWFPQTLSWEWAILRPLVLAALVAVGILTADFYGLAALILLLFGQGIAIVRSVLDGEVPASGDKHDEQENIFFLANNVTIIVRCPGDLFREASSHVVSKAHEPNTLRSITTLVFLAGVVMVGFAGPEFKYTYLIGHALQAVLFAFASGRKVGDAIIVNKAIWEIDEKETVSVGRRREAYIWACKYAQVGTEWLVDWNLANGETLNVVERGLEGTGIAVRKIINDSD